MPPLIKVAISSDFFSSVLKLPKAQQDKAVKFMEQFRYDPKSPGINYEIIKAARDKNLRSVRIDQTYRAIVLTPQKGNVYILLWADKHDDAYEWAKNKVLKINPENGVLQFLESEYIDEAQQKKARIGSASQGFFAFIRDRHLIRLGVPDELIPLVREVKVPADIEDLKKKIPDEAYEALSMLADGDSIDEVLSAYDVDLYDEVATAIDLEDFSSALDRPESKRRFLLASDDEALQSMLDAPLEKWRVFLHPLQRKLIFRDWNGPVRVLGGAGTGKTVVAMHRAKWLAERGKQVLLTTYTKNLAADIEQNLKKICSTEVMRKIEVINLDAWVKGLLHKQGVNTHFAFNEKQKHGLWQQALVLKPDEPDLPDSFYREEWEKVIQPHSINSLTDYFKARRIGRGIRLDRAMRKAVWPVFENYRTGLNDIGLKETEDAYRDAVSLLELKSIQLPYHSVIVDEAQDFGLNAFKLIRHLVEQHKNDLFIVGDPHQRIYGSKVILSHCGIKVVGRSHKLRVNYRTTEQIRCAAVTILEEVPFDDLDNGFDEQKGYRSLMTGDAPEFRCFSSAQEELSYLVEALQALIPGELSKTCIVTRRQIDIEHYCIALAKAGIPFYKVDHNSLDDIDHEGVRVSTMHRVKGLEFETMFVAGVNDGIIPLNILDSEDPTIIREHEQRERSLLYVAMTRAKRFCSVTGFEKLSKFIQH